MELLKFLTNIVGEHGALKFEEIIRNQHLQHDNRIITIVGNAALLLAATGMLNQIQKSLSVIWGLKVKPEKSVLNYFALHITSFLILIFVGFILLASTPINGLFLKYFPILPDFLVHAHLYEHVISFMFITLLFEILFWLIRIAIVPWRTALASTVLTSILFFLGKIGLSFYIAYRDINSAFGTASFLILLMIWVYYSFQILFIGASFAYVFGQRTGYEIKLTNQAVRYVHAGVISGYRSLNSMANSGSHLRLNPLLSSEK